MLNNLAKFVINNGGSITPLILSEEQGRGMGLCNVSIYLDDNGELLANIRNVHYILYHDEFGQNFHCKWGLLSYLNPEDDIKLRTKNYFCKLDPDTLEVISSTEIDTSKHDIKPIWSFIGLEDVRLVRWEGQLYYCGVRRDVKSNGEGRMELCKLDVASNKVIESTRERVEVEPHTHLEKNWMPILDMPFHYVRWCNPLEIIKVNPEDKSKQQVQEGKIDIISSEVVFKSKQKLNLPLGVRGGSQVIPFGNDGDRICVTHDTHFYHHQNIKKDAHYYHRFIIWDKDWNVKKVSKQFKFMDAMIEFSCGLIIKDNNLIITYGYQDNAAYALKMPLPLLDKIGWEVNYSFKPKSKKVTWHEPLIYTKEKYNNFKFKFPGLEKIEKNYSQCYQDLFTLSFLNGKTNGTYLEIGAGKPFYGNNTALLSELGWKGLSVDFNTKLIDSWKKLRPNDTFLPVDATKIDYIKLCQDNGLSRYIDYLQLDVDPAQTTFEVLTKIPFDTLNFGVITYEHDFYIDKNSEWRIKSRELLLNKGYILIAANISPDKNSPYEDWWVNKKYLNKFNKNIITDIDKESLFVEDYMING